MEEENNTKYNLVIELDFKNGEREIIISDPGVEADVSANQSYWIDTFRSLVDKYSFFLQTSEKAYIVKWSEIQLVKIYRVKYGK